MVVTPIGGGVFQVGWTNQAVYDSIQVWHYPPIGPSNLEATLAGTAATYTIPLAENGDYFNVRGVVNGVYSLFAGGRPCIGPTPPVATAATNLANTSFSANWNASPNGSGYLVDVSTDPAFGSFVPGYQNKIVGNVLTVAVTGLTAGTTYYYRVKATSGTGQSGYSNVITVTTTAPFSFTPDLSLANWTDGNGVHAGPWTSAQFQSTAVPASVTLLGFTNSTVSVSAIAGLGNFPIFNRINLNQPSLTSIDFTGCSSLQTVTNGGAGKYPLASVLGLGSATALNYLDLTRCSVTTIDISPCPLLTAVRLGTNNLTQAAVDSILSNLVAFGLSNGSCVLTGVGNSAPSAAGLVNKATLITRGWTCNTN